MARTRYIKPGFFKNEDLAECDPLARLLYAGLWTIADREGRLEDRPRRIKAELLAYDNADANVLLEQLVAQRFISRYSIDGQKYIQIESFVTHQQPHYKEEASKIPPPPGHVDSAYVAFGVTEKDRQAIFERDGYRCVNCAGTDKLSLDHIIPRSKGGTDDEDNLQTLCGSCNSSKNNRMASKTTRQVPSNKEGTSVQRQSNVSSTKVHHDTLNPLNLNLNLNSNLNLDPSHPTPAADAAECAFQDFFNEFWQLYPKNSDGLKPQRARAMVSARRVAPRDRPLVLQAVKHYSSTDSVIRGVVKHPQGFLNPTYWRDYVEEPTGGKQNGKDKRATAIANGFRDAFGMELDEAFGGGHARENANNQAGTIRQLDRPKPQAG